MGGSYKPRIRSARLHATAAEATGPRVLAWASEAQREGFEFGPTPICLSGGFGAGKTAVACLKGLWLSDVFPGNRGVIARRVWEELKHTTQSTFFKFCTASAYSQGKRSDSEKYLRLNNGSEVLWLHLDNPEVEGIIKGLEINWFLLDQAEEIREEMFDLLMSRLGRWDKALVAPQLLAQYGGAEAWPWKHPETGRPIPPTFPILTCNPEAETHWIYRRFHPQSPEWVTRHRASGYHMVQMNSLDNRFLGEQNKAKLLERGEAFVRRYVRGEWGIPEGQIHDIRPESLIEGDPAWVAVLLRRCTLHRALDHGDSAPTCCLWFAADRDGNLYVFREYYRANALVGEHRAELAALSLLPPLTDEEKPVPERYALQLADPSIFGKTRGVGTARQWSVADEYTDVKTFPRENAIFWTPGSNEELATRDRINELLRVDPERVHPVTGKRGAPRLYFVTRNASYPHGCAQVITETRAQRREKIGSVNGEPQFSDDRDESIVDHAYDPLRYMVAARPVPCPSPRPWQNPKSFAAAQRRLKDAAGRKTTRLPVPA